MHILKLTFMLVTFTGCFRPLSWITRFKRGAYNIYRTLVFVIMYTVVVFQFMDIILNVNNPDDFTDSLYMMLNLLVSGYKLLVMWVNYEDIVIIINRLTEEPFKPLNSTEMEIRRKFDMLIRSNTLRYALLIEAAWTYCGFSSYIVNYRHRELTYRQWVPDVYYSSNTLYVVIYVHQLLGTFYSANINVACDALICGLLMHMCCQIEILEHRLKNISQDTLGYCVQHHNSIIEFTRFVNTKFAQIIGFQFIISTLVICSNLFQLSKSSATLSDNLALIAYSSCMLTEIFIYCWFGNKVKSKSLQLTDSVFQTKWPTLSNSLKKSLLIIMNRTTVPIEIVTAYVIPMNLDSFVALLKTSYSAYNLLVRMQET